MSIFDMLLANAMGEGGGGGSSDFSTAEVTFIDNSSSSSFTISVPNLFMGDMYSLLTKGDISGGDVQEIVLYKGKSTATISYSNSSVTLSCTGDITINGLNATITGNGTITIS